MAVISDGDEQTTGSENELVKKDTDIVFFLTEVHLYELPKLECFFSGHSIIKYPFLGKIKLKNCPSMKTWGYGDMKFYHEKREWSINDYIAAGQHEINGNLMMLDGSNVMPDEVMLLVQIGGDLVVVEQVEDLVMVVEVDGIPVLAVEPWVALVVTLELILLLLVAMETLILGLMRMVNTLVKEYLKI